ncbi:MAG: L-seryl-tRNA(Sec) selenium transferase, partial [Nitrospirae bacterium]|nr:L-seryl-tRNA(Sec) selenium transferase [Nitrospirota bacterium]
MIEKQKLLQELPSVDEILKSPDGTRWLGTYPRRFVLKAIREIIDIRRKEIIEVSSSDVSIEGMLKDIEAKIQKLSALSLRPLINATGIVIHTNLGRSILSDKVLENVKKVSASY